MKYFCETERGVDKKMRSIQRGRDEKAGRPFRATPARKRADRSEKVDFRCRFSEWGIFHDIASIYRHRKNLNIYLLTVSIFLRLSPSFFVRAHLFLPSSCFLPPFLHTLSTDPATLFSTFLDAFSCSSFRTAFEIEILLGFIGFSASPGACCCFFLLLSLQSLLLGSFPLPHPPFPALFLATSCSLLGPFYSSLFRPYPLQRRRPRCRANSHRSRPQPPPLFLLLLLLLLLLLVLCSSARSLLSLWDSLRYLRFSGNLHLASSRLR